MMGFGVPGEKEESNTVCREGVIHEVVDSVKSSIMVFFESSEQTAKKAAEAYKKRNGGSGKKNGKPGKGNN